MRYRRYYSQRRPDGSREVISMGPIASYVHDSYLPGLRFFALMVVAIAAVAWPYIEITYYLHGPWGVFLAVLAEVLWALFLLSVLVRIRNHTKSHGTPRNGSRLA